MAANTEFATRTRRVRTSDRLRDLLLWLIILIWFLPALWIILTSVRLRNEVDAHPPVWIPSALSFDSYKILFGMPTPEGAFGLGGSIPVLTYGRNSIVIALVATAFAIVLGTLAGYAFSRFSFRGKNSLFLGFMLARAIPGIALSLPLFVLFARAGLSDTIPGMIITYIALNIPFTAWLMDGFFRRMYVALGIFCAMVILCLVIAFLLKGRLRIVAGNTGKPRQGSGDEAGNEIRPATDLRGAGGKGMSQ